jgi:hypothetical protein
MRLNRFPVVRTLSEPASGLLYYPWTIHQVNLATLPILDCKLKASQKWLNPHFGSSLSTAERALVKKPVAGVDPMAFVKDTLLTLFGRATGLVGGAPARVFSLADVATNNSDTLIIVDCLRYDFPCHTFICDAFLLPLTPDLIGRHQSTFAKLVGDPSMVSLSCRDGVMTAWKHLIPAFIERCRTWEHGPNCEYTATGHIPLTEEMEKVPICSCGSGKDVDGMLNHSVWRVFAPHATRIAISPLFAVSYLERIGRDPDAGRCALCRGKGKPKLRICTGCRAIKSVGFFFFSVRTRISYG